MRARVAALLVVAALATTGCAGDDSDPEPLVIGGDSASPSSNGSASPSEGTSPSATPSSPATTDQGGSAVIVGDLPSAGDEAAVAQAYVAYLQARAKAFNTVTVDLVEVSGVAIGEALEGIQSGVAYRSREKLHMVGNLKVDVTGATVSGKTAKVTACLDNATAEADSQGKVVELDPPSFYRGTADLRLYGTDVWLVAKADFTEVTRC